MTLGILTLNVANPSAVRAERQLAWLSSRQEHVLVLTETSGGVGTRLLLDRLAGAGWDVRGRALEGGERGVAVASRVEAAPGGGDVVEYLPSRAELVALERSDVIGLYVPSRDDSQEKVERKRRFCGALSAFLAERPARDAIVMGDLNVLEPVHRPHYATFRDWEYRLYDEFVVRGFVDAYRLRHPSDIEHSWLDYDNRGYRFDHAFVTASLARLVRRCEYIHGPRETDLSDHSALGLELEWPDQMRELETDPRLSGEPPSLF